MDPFDQLQNLIAEATQRREASERMRSSIAVRQDAVRQRLRLAAEEKVNDPTHPFTEEQFFNVIAQYTVIQTQLAESLGTCRGKIEALLILNAVVDNISDSTAFLDANPCGCPNCQ